MKINVGSKNQTKVQAVIDATKLYPEIFVDPEVFGVEVKIEEFGHPKNVKETVEGAIERAKQAFKNCEYSFGIEGGLMEVPYTKTGYMEVGACAIFDGKNIHLGLSPAFEWPTSVNEIIINGEGDASLAFHKLGLTEHQKLGNVLGGIVGFLTNQKIPREDFTKYSIIMAMIQIERKEWY